MGGTDIPQLLLITFHPEALVLESVQGPLGRGWWAGTLFYCVATWRRESITLLFQKIQPVNGVEGWVTKVSSSFAMDSH